MNINVNVNVFNVELLINLHEYIKKNLHLYCNVREAVELNVCYRKNFSKLILLFLFVLATAISRDASCRFL